MKRVCLSCGVVTTGSRCIPCQRAEWRRKNAARDPFARRLYASSAWRRLAEAVVAAASGCAYCGRSDVQLTADHVIGVRRAPGLALDPSNAVACCRSCQERRKHDPDYWGLAAPRKEHP